MTIARFVDLAGQVAVVTGAGRGIGEGIAHVLSEAGAAVVLAARRAHEVERVAGELRALGRKAIAVPTDVTDEAAVEALARRAVAEFGALDVWVNNAGGSPIAAPLTELPRAEWDATLALNLTAVWVCCRAAVKHMREGGRIVNVASIAAHGPFPGSGHYAAAKAAVLNLTQTLAAEVGPKVRVNAVSPGAVPTEIMMTALKLKQADLPNLEKALRLPLRRLGTPEDLGAAVLFFASPASAWITGQIIKVSGGP